MSGSPTEDRFSLYRVRADGARLARQVRHGWAAAYAEDVPEMLAEIDRLRAMERRVNDVKAALEGTDVADAQLVRRLL